MNERQNDGKERKSIFPSLWENLREKIVSSFWGPKVERNLSSDVEKAQEVADSLYPNSVFIEKTDQGYIFDQVHNGESLLRVVTDSDIQEYFKSKNK